MPVDKFGRMSDLKTKDTGVSLTYINNNYVRSDGETPLTGSLDMRGNTLYNVADPVNPQDVVTKVYVDNTKGSGVIGRKVGDAVSIKENLDFLGKQRIKNLPDPVNDHDAVTKEYVDEKDAVTKEYVDEKDAVTKKYVDDKTKNLFIDENDNIAFGLNVDMEGNKIFSLPEPEQDHEPATKKYVDDLQIYKLDKRGNVRFDRNINVGNNKIFSLKDPKKDYEATNKKYVDDTINKRLQEEKDNFLPQDPATKEYVDEAIKGLAGGDLLVSKEGVFIKANGHYRATASLDIDNHKMENLPDPVDDKDAVNKKYIDWIVENLTLKQGLIRENGGFNLVDSYINMNFNNVRNLGLPKNENDGVPRKFVDSMIKEVEEKINKRKQLIAVNVSYCGLLEEEDFPFKFSNNNNIEICKEVIFKSYKYLKGVAFGFVMPHSGRIKKIICEGLTDIDFDQMFNNLNKILNEEQFNKLEDYYGKYNFKDELIKDLLKNINFNTNKDLEEKLQPKEKTFFKIVKFTKNFLFKSGILNLIFRPPINDYDIVEEFEKTEVTISKGSNGIKTLMKFLNHDIVQLNEGETLNICITDFRKNLFSKDGILVDILKKEVIHCLFGKFSFNFTFLIELDPL